MSETYTFDVRIYKIAEVSGIAMETTIAEFKGLRDVKVNDEYLIFDHGDGKGTMYLPEKGTFTTVTPNKEVVDIGVYQ